MNATKDFSKMSGAEIGKAITAGTLDPVTLCEGFLERIAACEDPNIFLKVSNDRALHEAEASRHRYRKGCPLGPLDGVPISWKDLFDVAGTKTTAGSELFRNVMPSESDAPVVANLKAAGMVCLGKVNLSEFAFSGLGLNPHYGTPRNPNDPTTPRVPGGSSSGSGVSVARGLNPCSVGTDTGGSVRIPAAFSGVVGFKTSEGRIDKRGTFPLSYTLDTVGPLSKSVEDAILLDAAMRGIGFSDVKSGDLSMLTIVVPQNIVHEGVEDAVGTNFDACLRALSDAGARIERRNLGFLDEVQRITAEHGSITVAEAYFVHRERVEKTDLVNRIDRRVVSRIMGGKRMSAYDLTSLLQGRKRLSAEMEKELDGGLLAMPTTTHVAPKTQPLEADDDFFHEINMKTLRNTMLGNFLGTCDLALPSGGDGRGLPTSILFSAPQGGEDKLLAYGLSIEREIARLAG